MLGGFMNMGAQGIKTAFVTIAAVGTIGGSILIGDISDDDILGTDPTNSIIIENGTIPDQTSDGLIFIGAKDIASKAALSLYTEADVTTDTDETGFSHVLPVTLNGTTYYIMLTDSAP